MFMKFDLFKKNWKYIYTANTKDDMTLFIVVLITWLNAAAEICTIIGSLCAREVCF